jgi:hypothetical protein
LRNKNVKHFLNFFIKGLGGKNWRNLKGTAPVEDRVITQVEYQVGIRRKPPLSRGLDEVFRQILNNPYTPFVCVVNLV